MGGVLRLDDPEIVLDLLCLQLVKVRVKVGELVREDVRVGYDVKFIFAKLFLHLDYIRAKSVFPCQFKRLGKMINLLRLSQPFILTQLQ